MADLVDKRRYAFLSASFLSKQYKSIPVDILENAIFIFGGKRSWLFPSNREEMLEARALPAKYLEFDEDFKTLVLHKEKQGLVSWMTSNASEFYKSISDKIEAIVDPVSKENYLPLILDEAWWKTEFITSDAKYQKDINAIINNFKKGEFDYDSVMELLYQSNPTIVPSLFWAES